ncbi:hypothetical protein [Schleiferilactobacillus perolens]|uniref:Uncharacterized protein n=1 Tax=Schleiferilactobacillus perolens DSM 12744 TaxID=1423792 RepID=A0A0R1NC22_9LACO|nr:hypothetical protein [Schleiferilactobacillus perolens]KRL14531.1 hypothetical protein FD09_GL000180 [Schleiferilactobacillus perolens DSM 12744]
MKYISGLYALNIPDPAEQTTGDWHWGALDWTRIPLFNSSNSIYGDYGIRRNANVPHAPGNTFYNVANHIRALLDMLVAGQLDLAGGMRDDFICNDALTPEVSDKVWQLRHTTNWLQIDKFMGSEYFMQWEDYKDDRTHAATKATQGPHS